MSAEDQALVRECLKGDREAFTLLVERYERPLFNAARRMLGDDDEARDVAQTVFVKAYENLRSFDDRHRFYSWLYRIAVNESLHRLARRKRFGILDPNDESPSEGRSPEDEVGASELGRLVQDALMGLKTDHRAVIVLRHFQHCSYREMAYVLGIPEKTVKSRLFTARQCLRDLLAVRGILSR